MEPITYKKSGVDTEKAARLLGEFAGFVKSRPRDPNLLSGIGGFASCYDLSEVVRRWKHPLLVTCCDGVGTKVKLALEWGHIGGLGQDLVGMNVNDLLCTGAEPLVFLDYFACGELKGEILLPLLKSVQAGCELAGCSLAGGETAEMPGMYAGDEFDLAGFAVGVAERDAVLGPHRVRPGDRLVAVESSGLHSNGYSLVRKIIERSGIRPEDKSAVSPRTWAEEILEPTRIYVPLFQGRLSGLHALAHITGGGLYENLPRVLPAGVNAVVHDDAWSLPPLFAWLGEQAGLPKRDLLGTWNGGVGMIAVCPESEVAALTKAGKARGVAVWEIGEIRPADSPEAPAQVVWA